MADDLKIAEKQEPVTPQQLGATTDHAEPVVADEDWQVESQSHDMATPPDDTTADQAGDADAQPIAADGDAESFGRQPQDASRVAAEAGGEESQSAESAGETPVEDGDQVSASAEKPKAAPKPETKKASRVDELQQQINERTWRKHQLQRDIEAAEARLRDLQARTSSSPPQTADLATQQTDGGAPEPPKATVPNEPPPIAPNFADFDDEKAFKAATETWQRDFGTWHERQLKAREEALRKDLTTGLEHRLTAERRAELSARADQEFQTRLQTAKAQHEDWDAVTKNVAVLRSSWAFEPDGRPVGNFVDPSTNRPVATPFLYDVVRNTPDGGEFLYYLGSHPEEAEVLAELHPTQHLREAVVRAPSPTRLMAYFATPEGRAMFESMKAMHPAVVHQQVGLLSAQMTTTPRDSVPSAPVPITHATPPAKSPRGGPRVQPASNGSAPFNFEEWVSEANKAEGVANPW